MTADDLPTIRDWLAEPHVAAPCGDPAEQFALVSGGLGHSAMNQFAEFARYLRRTGTPEGA